MRYRVNTAIGIVAASVALALLPAVSASASVDSSSAASNASSAFCRAYYSSLVSNPKIGTYQSQAAKAVHRGNWKAAKKAYLGVYAVEAPDVQKVVAGLKNAPSKIKSAAGVLLSYANEYVTILKHSTSIKQFTKSAVSVSTSRGAKTTAAANTLSAYYKAQCLPSGGS